jgi:excisionase family DNA binding protein
MLLTIREVSQLLHVKPSTLYAWAAQGRVPCFKLHGLVRFRREDIDRWVESFRIAAVSKVNHRTHPRRSGSDLDTLIARAKGQAYNCIPRGNQTEIKPHRKGGA